MRGLCMRFSDIEESTDRERLRSIYAEELNWQRNYFAGVNTEIRRLILFLNAGSAVALMTFMGTSEIARGSPAAWVALSLFCSGVVFLSLSYALGYHILNDFLRKMAQD